MSDAYRDAGVDLDAAHASVARLKPLAEATRTPGVMEGLGGFGALFSLREAGLLGRGGEDLVLVSSTDGVGSKLKLAFAMDRHDTIGVDCVAMCVNDVAVTGAKPLFFLDYVATASLNPAQLEAIVGGMASACIESGCALVGGETAELPGFYARGEYDVAGFCVGAARREALLSGRDVRVGDKLLGLSSSGVHSNGFSLVRALLERGQIDLHAVDPALDATRCVGEVLLTPTRLYVRPMQTLCEHADVRRAAHITGGGVVENLPRVLPKGLGARVVVGSWQVPAVFGWLAALSPTPLSEAQQRRVFNMGLGCIAVVRGGCEEAIASLREAHGLEAVVIGEVIEGEGVSYV